MATTEIDRAFADMVESKSLPHYDALRDGKFDAAKATVKELIKAIKTSVHLGVDSGRLVEEFIWKLGDNKALLEKYFDESGKYCYNDAELGAELRGHGYVGECDDAQLSVRYLHVSTKQAAEAGNTRLFRWLLGRKQPISEGTLSYIVSDDNLECLTIFRELRPKRLAKQIDYELMTNAILSDAKSCMPILYDEYIGDDPNKIRGLIEYAYEIDRPSFLQFMMSRDPKAIMPGGGSNKTCFSLCSRAPEARIMKYLIGSGLVDCSIWRFSHAYCSEEVYRAYLGAGIFPDLKQLLEQMNAMPAYYLVSAVKHLRDELDEPVKSFIATNALLMLTADEKALDTLMDMNIITSDTVDLYRLIDLRAGSGLRYLQKRGFYLDLALLNMRGAMGSLCLRVLIAAGVVMPADFGKFYANIPMYAEHSRILNGTNHDSDSDD